LKSSHISWISSILQTVLITFQKELQEKSETELKKIYFSFIQDKKI
jgi:hypothetical protein